MPRQLTDGERAVIENALVAQAPKGLSDSDFDRWFGPRFDGAIAQAEHSTAPVSGSALRRLLGGVGDMLNPVTMAKGLYQAARHPMDTVTGIGSQMAEQGRQAADMFEQGRYSESVGHGLGMFPVIGPLAAGIGEQMASGDVAGGMGRAAGLLAPMAASGVLRGRIASKAARGVPEQLERAAASQVAEKVLAPGNVRFKGKAQAVAPEMLRRGLRGSRDDLAQIADEGSHTAGRAIDDAIAAGGGGQSGVLVDPIVSRLRQRIDALTINGEPIKGAEDRVAGLQARIDYLERVARTRQTPRLVPPGQAPPPVSRALSFDDLRKFRDEQYRLADEARAFERMGNPSLTDEGFAAFEAGSAVRQEFADLLPELATANADYTFYKTLGDVLDPAQGRPKVSAPSSGITGGAATSGAVAGSLISPKAALVLSVVRPWLQKVRSEPAWQLADAQSKMRLAEAIRRGDVPTAQKWMVRIGEVGVATNPTESRRAATRE